MSACISGKFDVRLKNKMYMYFLAWIAKVSRDFLWFTLAIREIIYVTRLRGRDSTLMECDVRHAVYVGSRWGIEELPWVGMSVWETRLLRRLGDVKIIMGESELAFKLKASVYV